MSMWRSAMAALAAITVTLGGCAGMVRDTTRDQLQGLAAHSDPMNHLAYEGSDKNYHYFVYSQPSQQQQEYRLPRSQLGLTETFPRGQGTNYMVVPDDFAKK